MKTTILMMIAAAISIIIVMMITTTMTLPTITPAAVYASFSLSTGEDIETTQDEFTRNMEEAMEEVQREQTAELFGGEENVPTIDEFMEGAEQEGDFDDERERQEMQENSIEINEETGKPIASSADVRPKGYDTEFAITFLNQTFTKMLNSPTEPEIETEEVQISLDEGEEEDFAQRQTIYYEFIEDNPADDIRIYTAPGQTVQSLATHIATHLNSTDMTLYDNGRATIFCEGALFADESDDTIIYAPHNYTAANGYQYVNDTIIDPVTGQEILSTAYGLHSIDDYIAEAETSEC